MSGGRKLSFCLFSFFLSASQPLLLLTKHISPSLSVQFIIGTTYYKCTNWQSTLECRCSETMLELDGTVALQKVLLAANFDTSVYSHALPLSLPLSSCLSLSLTLSHTHTHAYTLVSVVLNCHSNKNWQMLQISMLNQSVTHNTLKGFKHADHWHLCLYI